MAGFAPGGVLPPQAMTSAPKKKPSVLGTPPTPSGAAPVGVPAGYQPPVTRPAAPGSPSLGGLQTALGGTAAAPGFKPATSPPLTETTQTLGGTPPVQGGPVSGAPVAAAPFPVGAPTPAPLNLEQTLTNQYQTGAPANPRLGATQGMVDNAAQGLSSGPNRTDIGRQAFTDYLSQSGDQFNKDIRNITQRNAAAGRLGSGMYGSDLVDATTAANRDRNYEANKLSQDLANGTISDQFNKVGVLGQLEGQQSGESQQGLNNLFNYGNTAFDHQITNQQQQQSIDDQQFRQLLAMLQLQGG